MILYKRTDTMTSWADIVKGKSNEKKVITPNEEDDYLECIDCSGKFLEQKEMKDYIEGLRCTKCSAKYDELRKKAKEGKINLVDCDSCGITIDKRETKLYEIARLCPNCYKKEF